MEMIDTRLHLRRRGGEGDEKSAAKKGGVDATGDAVTLSPVPATDVTDEQIADAKKWAEGDKGAANAGCTFDAEALATAAAKRRDDAVAAKKAEEEAAKRAEEAKQARTIDTDYFTMVLPDWFPIDEYEITSMNWSSVGAPAAFRVSKIGGNQDPNQDADFYIFAYTEQPSFGACFSTVVGTTSGGLKVQIAGGSYGAGSDGSIIDDRPFDMDPQSYANALAACVTLK